MWLSRGMQLLDLRVSYGVYVSVMGSTWQFHGLHGTYWKVATTGVDFFTVLLLLGGDLFITPNKKRTAEKSTPMVATYTVTAL